MSIFWYCNYFIIIKIDIYISFILYNWIIQLSIRIHMENCYKHTYICVCVPLEQYYKRFTSSVWTDMYIQHPISDTGQLRGYKKCIHTHNGKKTWLNLNVFTNMCVLFKECFIRYTSITNWMC